LEKIASMADLGIEIPDWLGLLPARQIADVIPTSPGLRSALASFTENASFKAVVEILQVRLEHDVGVKGWDREDLASAVAWLIEAKETAVSEFLEVGVRARVAALLARPAGKDGILVNQVLENFRRTVQTSLLSATNEWKMRLPAISGHLTALVPLLERLAQGQRLSILDEISLFYHGLSDRDRTFVVRYLGLDGQQGETLETLGAQAGVTRERVRQIVQRFIDRNSSLRPPLPICEATISVLKTAEGPLTLDRWSEELPEVLRPDSPSVLNALRTLERWGWLAENTWLRAGGFLLVVPGMGREELGREFLRRVTPALRNAMALGAASVAQLSLALHEQRTAVESLLRSSGRWEQADGDWFVLKESRGYLLPHVAEKMLAILGPLTVDQLRSGLRRYRESKFRQRLEVPPRQILRRVLKAAGMRVSENGDVVDLLEVPSYVKLNGGEAALVDVFRDNGVLTVHEVVSTIRERGLSEALGRYLLTSSPLITRVTYGLYALRGRRVTHAEIEIAAGRLNEQSEPSLLDQRFQVDGSILARYRLPTDRDLVTYYVRPGMIPEGVWTLVDAQAREPILVRSTYVTGLQQVGRGMKKAGATEIEVRFDVGRGEVRVAAATSGERRDD
jgi:sigma-70-like protein